MKNTGNGPDRGRTRSRRKASHKRKRSDITMIIVCAGLAAVLALLGGAFLIYNIGADPVASFVAPETTEEVAEIALAETPEPEPEPSPTAEPEPPDEYAALREEADTSMMQNIVNIMLIGADYAEERESWSGKNGLSSAHADVMIVLAVNFDENRADLISLPRDTYTNYIPGAQGIYKLNASLDCGGGITAQNGAGFEKVCDAASVLLGGLPVDYYYAVTMPAVKQLVDMIGGVDYDLEVSFKIQGRSYKEGFQHMDGQAVLDYLRVRKSGTGLAKDEQGDANRVNRQKKMLVAIFEKIKKAGLLTNIPKLISTFSGQLYTNCTAGQTAALALYAHDMPKENIGMYSMSGSAKTLYTWNFTFTNMANRRSIMKSVYGIDVNDIRDCTKEYASYLYYKALAEQYLSACSRLTDFLEDAASEPEPEPERYDYEPDRDDEDDYRNDGRDEQDRGGAFIVGTPDEEPEPEFEPEPEVGDLEDVALRRQGPVVVRLSAVRMASKKSGDSTVYTKYLDAYDELKSTLSRANSQAKKFLSYKTDSMAGVDGDLSDACDAFKSAATKAADAFGYGRSIQWDITPLAKTNEIYVDFR